MGSVQALPREANTAELSVMDLSLWQDPAQQPLQLPVHSLHPAAWDVGRCCLWGWAREGVKVVKPYRRRVGMDGDGKGMGAGPGGGPGTAGSIREGTANLGADTRAIQNPGMGW